MSDYRRAKSPGGTFFFTVVAHDRQPLFRNDEARHHLRAALEECKRQWPFTIEAMVLLPDHLHTLWTLPDGDSEFSKRWGWIKKTFTQRWLDTGHSAPAVSASKSARHRRGVWQVRFWEHQIRDQRDMEAHLNYIHYNPVRHELVKCPHAWPYSTFRGWVQKNQYPADWCCVCKVGEVKPPAFDSLPIEHME